MSTKPLGFIARDEVGVTVAPVVSPVFNTNISTPSVVSPGALGITPASGANVNIDLATTGDFAVNTSQIYADTSSGNVGVGTTTPGVKLDVAGGSIRVQDTGVASSGKGLELVYIPGTDNGYIQAYNRDTTAYKVLNLEGSSVLLNPGSGGNVGIGTTDQFGAGVGVVGMANASVVPSSNPFGGGVWWVENGALKYRGSSGTVTTLAPA